MTDIVDRLRALNADFLHEEAADEIERLRAERDALKVECYAIGENYEIAKRGQLSADEIERLRAEIVLLEATGAEAADEIERLRAALSRIANGDFCAQHMSSPPICVRAYEARLVVGEKRDD